MAVTVIIDNIATTFGRSDSDLVDAIILPDNEVEIVSEAIPKLSALKPDVIVAGE